MAEFNSRQKTALATSRQKAAPADIGEISVFVVSTPATAAWAQNDTFSTGVILPKGSRILRSGKVYTGAYGAGVTLDVGLRSADGLTVIASAGIASAVSVAAAGVKDLNGGTLLTAVNGGVLTQDVEVYATLAGANPTDDIQAEFEIHAIVPGG